MLKCHYVRKKNVVIIQIIYLKGSNLCSLAVYRFLALFIS